MTKKLEGIAWARYSACMLAMILILTTSFAADAAQKDKKKKTADNSAQDSTQAPLPTPAAEEIDHDIGEMLAGFQIGDVEMMHKHYADDVTFVSGAYEPPVAGWQKYVPIYQRQRAGFQGIQLIRRNTLISTHGDAAWASYQWEFLSLFNGQPYTARGQTTLVFNKIGTNWMIVHNHTSEVYPASQQPAGQQQPPQHTPAASPAVSGAPRS